MSKIIVQNAPKMVFNLIFIFILVLVYYRDKNVFI